MLAVLTTYFDVQRRADDELALRSGSPSDAAIENLDPTTDIITLGEVALIAQVDTGTHLCATWRTLGAEGHAVAYPLVATDQVEVSLGPVLGFVYYRLPFAGGNFPDPAQLLPVPVGVGAVGPSSP